MSISSRKAIFHVLTCKIAFWLRHNEFATIFILKCLKSDDVGGDSMIPVMEEKPNNPWNAFGRGFADGLGSMGNLVVLCRRDHVRRTVQETKRRNWQTDWSMIRGDFKIALGKLHEPREEK